LLRRTEFLAEGRTFRWFDVTGGQNSLQLPPRTLAFSFCQVPVLYHLDKARRIELTLQDGRTSELDGDGLDRETSAAVFERSGRIARIDVFTSPGR
jgi:hypothetical protein